MTCDVTAFDVALLGLTERAILRAVIGAEAEALVTVSIPDATALRGFVAITAANEAANELDAVAHNDAIADAHGADLPALVAWARRWLPDSVAGIDTACIARHQLSACDDCPRRWCGNVERGQIHSSAALSQPVPPKAQQDLRTRTLGPSMQRVSV